MGRDAKRKRAKEDEGHFIHAQQNFYLNNTFVGDETQSASDGEDSESETAGGLDHAVLHTLWNIDYAQKILHALADQPGLSIFKAIRSTWGHGLEVKKAVDQHIEDMYESGECEPGRGDTMFDMLSGTRKLAKELFKAGDYDAAFFFAHACAEMIRRCEGDDADDPEEVEKWARGLDELMVGAVKGWRAKSKEKKRDTKKGKGEAAGMIKLLEKGETAEG